MREDWLRELLTALDGWLPAAVVELLMGYGEWLLAILGAVSIALAMALAWALWRRLKRAAASTGRIGQDWWRALLLLRHPSGRRALRLAREIRRGCRRLSSVMSRTLEDPAERLALDATLKGFILNDLHAALEQMHTWVAIGGEIRVQALEQQVSAETARWSGLADGAEREALELTLARRKQQLALARRSETDRERLLSGLDDVAAAIRTLEAELVALGDARTQALSGFQARLSELSEVSRRQREVYLEYPARPG